MKKESFKKKLKAVAAVAFAGVLAMALFGCSSSESSDSSSDSNEATETEATEEAGSEAEQPAGESESLRFVTGGESGTYYAYGSVLAQYATNGDYGLDITALSGNGSQANIQALEDDDADIAFCQSDVLTYAYEGTNIFEGAPYQDFSVVANLYQEQVQIVTCDESIKTVSDLAGKTVSIGAAGSGVYFNAIDVLGVYGLTTDDITPVYQDFGDSADSLKDGKIDAAFIVAGAPTTAITDLSTSKTAYLVSMDEEHVNQLCESNPFYAPATIEPDVYGLAEATNTVSVGAVVIANDSVSEDAIYNFTKSLFDGQQSNADAHAKYSELVLEDAAGLTSVPYHAGAAKYYQEQDITVETK